MRVFLGLSLCVVAFVAACGSSPAANPPPPVGPYAPIDAGDPESGTDRYLPDLTQKERTKLCDWAAGTMGGYGKVTKCDGSVVVNFSTQATCLAQYLGGCDSVTVLEYEECIKVVGKDVCAGALYTATECFKIQRCIGKLDGGPPPPELDSGGGG
mgnify:CR=1 FL=1